MSAITIIGGGPAGSLAAILLSRAGWRVTLIEQHPFPRDKVCGECLSALGISVLTRAGIAPILRSLKPVILQRAAIHAPDGSSATIPLGHDMWGLSRRAMDAALLDEAKRAGASVLQPTRCERIESDLIHDHPGRGRKPPTLGPANPGLLPTAGMEEERIRVTVRDLSTNQMTILEVSHVLLADGKASLLPDRPRPTKDFGIKAHFVNVAAPFDTIGLFGVRGHYGGVAPIEAGRFNTAFSIPASDLDCGAGDLDRLFGGIIRENRELARQFAGAQRISPWLAAPLPRFPVADHWPPRVIPLGNAAAAIEPIGGEGMGLALRSAELAAASLIADPLAIDRPGLRKSCDHLWQVRRPACRAVARMISSPTLARPMVEFLAANESLGRIALRCIGK